ncbi:hypothetical protein AAG607_12135 [Citromicrobium bathyomarinum]|uniref:hypothetical protein n=1 Tax=Citromicrobium bathyomarinum TaxID=72174 RepID=UPI00315A7025
MHRGCFCEMTSAVLAKRHRIVEAVMALADGHGTVAEHRARNWASITFSGTRHKLVLDFEGPAAVEAGEELIARLEDHEFEIPGQLVADAAIKAVDRSPSTAFLIVHAEILLLEEK